MVDSKKSNYFTYDLPNETTSSRKKVRKTINEGLSDNLSDTELLIALLSPSHPHVDVTPIANALISKFHTYGNVIKATAKELSSIKEITTTAINTIIFSANIYREINKRSIPNNKPSKIERISDVVLWLNQTQNNNFGFHIFFISSIKTVLTHRFIEHDNFEISDLSLEIIKSALTQNVTGLIVFRLTTNPDATPNKQDISFGRILHEKGQNLEVMW